MEHGGGIMEESGSSLGALWKLSGDSLGALWRQGWPWGGHGAIWAWEVHFALQNTVKTKKQPFGVRVVNLGVTIARYLLYFSVSNHTLNL